METFAPPVLREEHIGKEAPLGLPRLRVYFPVEEKHLAIGTWHLAARNLLLYRRFRSGAKC
jgi:hypothetical protein